MIKQEHVLITTMLVCLTYSNLICDGNFESYAPSTAYTPAFRPNQTYYRSFVPQNQSCWYIKGGTAAEQIQIKKIYNPPTLPTIVGSLPKPMLTLAAHQLCQSVQLQISKKYRMNFTVYSNQNKNRSRTTVLLNNMNITEVVSQNFDRSQSGNYNFDAVRVINQICFVYSSVDILSTSSGGLFPASSTAIDDVQLVQDPSSNTGSSGSNLSNIGIVQNSSISGIGNNSIVDVDMNVNASMNNSIVSNPANGSLSSNYSNSTSADTSTNTSTNDTINTTINGLNNGYSYQFSNGSDSLNQSSNVSSSTQLHSFYQNVWIKKVVFDAQIQTNSVKFQTNYLPPIQIRDQLSKLIKVYVQDAPQIDIKYYTINQNNTALAINIPNSVLYFNELKIEFPVNVTYENTNIFYLLFFQEKSSSNLNSIANVLKWVKVIGKTFICSYFIFSLISFWNLLLMYNFLFIKMVPKFTHITLTVFSKIFYESNSLVDQFQPLSRYLSQLQNAGVQYNRLPKQIDGQIWFGNLGFSDNFLVNNAQTLILFVFLIAKLWIFSIINNLLAKKIHVRKITFKHRLNVFFVQVIVSSPQILISSISNIINSGAVDSMSSISSCLSIVSILFISIVIYANYLLSQPCQNSILIHQQLNGETNKDDMRQEFNRYQSYDYLLFFLLHLFIPIFVVAQAKFLFFIITTSVLTIRLILFFKKKHFFKGFQYFRLLSSQIGWGIYHFIFTSFWIFDIIKLSVEPDSNSNKYVNVCGDAIIIILIFVAIVQVLDFALSFPTKYLMPFIKTIKLFYQIQKSKIIDLNTIKNQNLEGNQKQMINPLKKSRNQKQKITLLQHQRNKILSEQATLQTSKMEF